MQKFRNIILVLSLSICSNLFFAGCNTLSIANQKDSSFSNPTVNNNITIKSKRNAYNKIDLNQLSAEIPRKGDAPKEIALIAFGNEETEGFVEEEIEVDTSNPEKTIVFLTQTNLPDDSVDSIRYRIDFESDGSQWQMKWAGQQFICQSERGSEKWSKELCY